LSNVSVPTNNARIMVYAIRAILQFVVRVEKIINWFFVS
jgi:hypothetical protein